jgi:transposase
MQSVMLVVPGRKTDMSDAEWLSDVAAHGMIRPSFVPPAPIRELRELTRYRKTQIDARASEVQRLEKVLQDAGIKLTSVASNQRSGPNPGARWSRR